LTALVVCVGAFGPQAAASPPKHRHHGLTKREKAKARHRLQRLIRKHPATVLKRGFMKRAASLDLTLPLTLRLRRSDQGPYDDVLSIVWDSSTWAWPAGFVQLAPITVDDPPPGGLVPLDGRTSIEAQFGNDVSGYNEPGVVETLNGRRLQFSSQLQSPIPVTSISACGDPAVPAVQLTQMDLVTGQGTNGVLSLFEGSARVSLHARVATTTQSLSDTCTGTFDDGDRPPGTYDQGASPPAGDPIVPITFDAVFRVSPAVDADGRLRLGILTLAGSDVVQPTTFARISMCVQQATSGPCTVARFPARLSMSQLSAEVLIGDQF
jgi:hypothetical protein